MSTEQVYHYVYRITNIIENKHYYGKRTSKIEPKLDLGIKYFSSSSNKEFINDQKSNRHSYKYKIVSYHSSSSEAISKEIKLHSKFNVGVSSNFYSKVKQTFKGFDATGMQPSAETRSKLSKANLGKTSWNFGKKLSPEIKANMSKAQSGLNHSRAKTVNIYRYCDNVMIAEKVCITVWAGENGYNRGHLTATTKADITIPPSSSNRCHHKGIYAVYTD